MNNFFTKLMLDIKQLIFNNEIIKLCLGLLVVVIITILQYKLDALLRAWL